MASIKVLLVGFLTICLSGCASMSMSGRGRTTIYEQGYRAGVGENIDDYVQKFEGGDFPYFNWAGPIVQRVRVPAQVSNGMFIPEHTELVVIRPGEWKISPSYPISSGKRRYYNEQDTVQYFDVNVADITTLPEQYSRPERNLEPGEKGADNPRGVEEKD